MFPIDAGVLYNWVVKNDKISQLPVPLITAISTHKDTDPIWCSGRQMKAKRWRCDCRRVRGRLHECVFVCRFSTHVPLLWGPAVWHWWRGGPRAPAGSWLGKRRCGPRWTALQTGPLHIYLHTHTHARAHTHTHTHTQANKMLSLNILYV